MAGSSRTVQVNVVGDSSKLQGAMSKAGSSAESAVSRISKAWSGVASTLGGSLGGALSPITDVLGGVSQAFENIHSKGEKVGATITAIGAGTAAAATGAVQSSHRRCGLFSEGVPRASVGNSGLAARRAGRPPGSVAGSSTRSSGDGRGDGCG